METLSSGWKTRPSFSPTHGIFFPTPVLPFGLTEQPKCTQNFPKTWSQSSTASSAFAARSAAIFYSFWWESLASPCNVQLRRITTFASTKLSWRHSLRKLWASFRHFLLVETRLAWRRRSNMTQESLALKQSSAWRGKNRNFNTVWKPVGQWFQKPTKSFRESLQNTFTLLYTLVPKIYFSKNNTV